MSGQWAQVELPDGSVRQDWVPAEQPPSPDGSAGMWHVVEDLPGQPTRWEWNPTAARPAAASARTEPQPIGPVVDLRKPRRVAAGPAPNDDRAALLIGVIWGAFVALLPGVRTPLAVAWDKVSEQGTSGSGVGFALLLALLVAVYVLGVVAIAMGFARLMNRPPGPRRSTPTKAPGPAARTGT